MGKRTGQETFIANDPILCLALQSKHLLSEMMKAAQEYVLDQSWERNAMSL